MVWQAVLATHQGTSDQVVALMQRLVEFPGTIRIAVRRTVLLQVSRCLTAHQANKILYKAVILKLGQPGRGADAGRSSPEWRGRDPFHAGRRRGQAIW